MLRVDQEIAFEDGKKSPELNTTFWVDPSGQVPGLWFQQPHEEGPKLPDSDLEQRWHFDVWVPIDEGERRVRAALEAGGTLVSDAAAPSYWVLEDADGNRHCVCTRAGR